MTEFQPTTAWLSAPKQPTMQASEIPLWLSSLLADKDTIAYYRSCLAEDELTRADRFMAEKHRRRFIMSHGILRHIIARYLNTQPHHITFNYGEKNKPEIRHPPPYINEQRVYFNMSHSHDVALYAFSLNTPIGVDIEAINERPSWKKLAKTVFSPNEYQAFKTLAAEDQLAGFFAGWTRKEAFIKAIGQGLYFPLDQFDVALNPKQPARLKTIYNQTQLAIPWSLLAFDTLPGFAAALASKQTIQRLDKWRYPTTPL